ncbi:hypothetical protein TNCV_469731 [Trichonephila clavipes]|nr:hypothetical protein TNCV_469731 [Trichonephila clavipes]
MSFVNIGSFMCPSPNGGMLVQKLSKIKEDEEENEFLIENYNFPIAEAEVTKISYNEHKACCRKRIRYKCKVRRHSKDTLWCYGCNS